MVGSYTDSLLKRVKFTWGLLLHTFSCGQRIPGECITAPKMNMLIQTNFSAWRKVETVLTFFFSTDRMGRHHELLSKTLPKVLDHNHHLNVLIIMKIQAFNMQLSMFSQRYKGNGSTSKSVLERASTKWRVLLRVRLHEALHCPFWAKIGSVDSQSD